MVSCFFCFTAIKVAKRRLQQPACSSEMWGLGTVGRKRLHLKVGGEVCAPVADEGFACKLWSFRYYWTTLLGSFRHTNLLFVFHCRNTCLAFLITLLNISLLLICLESKYAWNFSLSQELCVSSFWAPQRIVFGTIDSQAATAIQHHDDLQKLFLQRKY